ncbi:triggering receptor expressed on myeloid cells 1 isoform X2 [Octodon degus]|uniref:Triggering receptor expressed on myeloid cells 1 isoform X2 n=1 Tax=Octodon degus TaxID=10160 RepID=A0A6P6EU40_OCTDE|nr:triggering receptor expressed on myeloid cells 1 isoform X2 [Octodon degus]
MEGTGTPGWTLREPLLLLLLCASGLHAEGQYEDHECVGEGQDVSVDFHYNSRYKYSFKAWQRVESQGPPKTLVQTETKNEDLNRAQVGRFVVEDNPTTGIINITMMQFQRQDVGLYQCVILVEPLVTLPYPVWLSLCPEHLSTTHRNHRTVTQPLSKPTAVIPSPDPDGTGVIRVPFFGIVIPVVCGLFSKSLVFIILFAVTQRSFSP